MIAVITQERIVPTSARSECDCEQVSHRDYRTCSWRGGEHRFSMVWFWPWSKQEWSHIWRGRNGLTSGGVSS